MIKAKKLQPAGLPRLPPPEDIYDYDSDELKQISQNIITAKASCPDPDTQDPASKDWYSEATYILGLIEQQLKQRHAVESFGNMCIGYDQKKGLSQSQNVVDYLQRFDDFNRQLQLLAKEVESRDDQSKKTLSEYGTHLPPIHNNRRDTATTASELNSRSEVLSNDSHYSAKSRSEKSSVGISFNNKKKRTSNNLLLELAKAKVDNDKFTFGKSTNQKILENEQVKSQKPAAIKEKQTENTSDTSIPPLSKNSATKASAKTPTPKQVKTNPRSSSKAETKGGNAAPAIKKPKVSKISNKQLLEMVKREEEQLRLLRQARQRQLERPAKPTTIENSQIKQKEQTNIVEQLVGMGYERLMQKQQKLPNLAEVESKAKTQSVIEEEEFEQSMDNELARKSKMEFQKQQKTSQKDSEYSKIQGKRTAQKNTRQAKLQTKGIQVTPKQQGKAGGQSKNADSMNIQQKPSVNSSKHIKSVGSIKILEQPNPATVVAKNVNKNQPATLLKDPADKLKIIHKELNLQQEVKAEAPTKQLLKTGSVEQIQEEIKPEEQSLDQKETKKFELKARVIRTVNSATNSRNQQIKLSTQQKETHSQPQVIDFQLGSMEKLIKPTEEDEEERVQVHSSGQLQNKRQNKQAPASNQQKDCYSQEYWNKVREQALDNLEKVKKMKQEREMEKNLISQRVDQALSATVSSKPGNNETSDTQKTEEPEKEQKEMMQTKTQFRQTQNSQAKCNNAAIKRTSGTASKGQSTNNSTGPVKKATKKPANPEPSSLTLKNLPQLIDNFLEVLPSFNHMFTVNYLKPQAEAALDISTLMKQMYALFTIHKETLQDGVAYHKPLFSAFDNFNTVYINEPKQLVLHTQTTHVDLKTMIARLSVFNENIHGHFDQNGSKNTLYYRVVKNREEVYDIISTSFLRTKNWRELPHGHNLKTSWNLFWSWAKPEVDFNKLLCVQKVNHFPLNKNMSRKDLLYRNIQAFRKTAKINTNFLPVTFNLPKQFSQFSAKFHEDQLRQLDYNIWIMKPIGKSRGRGIKLINNINDLNYLDNIVVQKYLKNPLLIDGYKFDMRIYVLVTHVHPLQAFVYREGFARMSTEKYTLNPDSIKNTFIHLTNFAIQKNNRDAVSEFGSGSKISLKTLQQKLERKGVSWQRIWTQVHDIIIKSLLACSVGMPVCPSAFELFGYDIMVDEDLNCYLIEINSSPSLQRSHCIDQIIKQSLIDDIIDIVDPVCFDREQCAQVFVERLARKTNSPKEDNLDIGRMLGWKMPRKIGEMPKKMGLFERVAPQPKSQELEKLVKYNPNIRYHDN